METIAVPENIRLTDGTPQEFLKFKQKFDFFLLAVEGDKKLTEERKIALFVCAGGDIVLEAFSSLNLATNESTYEDVTKILEKHFVGEVNVVYERYKFRCRVQEDAESFSTYLTDLKLKIKSCK